MTRERATDRQNLVVSAKIRVLVADDQTLVRTGFRVILEAEGDIEVVAEADTGVEAIRQAQMVEPDVILMDIRMPELDGLSATEEILRHPDPPTIVVLTTFDQNEYVYRALRAGAAGFLLKDAPSTRLIAAVRAAATGDSLIEPSITRRLVERFVDTTRPQGLPRELAALTERELDVLRLVARGLSNAEIAAELVVAETTVKTHVARILTKLGVRDRVQAVVVAYETGFVTRDPGGYR
jgi:DNA-binding NarL/FixJ family response regulator